jgi:hypothetical protein
LVYPLHELFCPEGLFIQPRDIRRHLVGVKI